jgi:flagellar basal body-associated protein FliL
MKKVKYKDKKKKGGMKKLWKIVIVVAVILVVLVAGFFAFRAFQGNRDSVVFSNGVQYGYAQAIVQLMNMSLSCQPVPLYAGNATIDVIAVDCLQQAPVQ